MQIVLEQKNIPSSEFEKNGNFSYSDFVFEDLFSVSAFDLINKEISPKFQKV
jgi:hypothetical protein